MQRIEAAAAIAAGLDVAARGGDDVLHDREPEAGAARGARRVGAPEALEEPRQVSARRRSRRRRRSARRTRRRAATREREASRRGRRSGSRSRRGSRRRSGASAGAAAASTSGRRPPASATPARAAESSSSSTTSCEHRQRVRAPERDDLLAALELGEEEDLVDQRARVLDLGARLLEQRLHVGARQVGGVEQREDPGERRPQLVRDGGGEAGAELVEAAVVGVVCLRHQIVTTPSPGPNRPSGLS